MLPVHAGLGRIRFFGWRDFIIVNAPASLTSMITERGRGRHVPVQRRECPRSLEASDRGPLARPDRLQRREHSRRISMDWPRRAPTVPRDQWAVTRPGD